MKTGKHLKIEQMGSAVMGVRLFCDPNRPEPEHFRIVLPFGDIDIVRCTDGKSYWAHMRVNSESDVKSEQAEFAGVFLDGRIDLRSKHASECNAGDFGNPDMYHMAVKFGFKA